MAESPETKTVNCVINQDIFNLLNGTAVPVNTVDLKRTDSMQFVPKTKVNVGYIVMTVILQENRVLMVQEAKKECRGYWYLPAGRLEPNETIVHGAKREVKEETGLDCEITTLLSVHFASTRWIRLCFAGEVTGGCLKTLEQRDEESLQAAYYDIWDVLNSRISLRSCDILPVIQHAVTYKQSAVPLHSILRPNLVIHTHMLHRIMLVGDLGDERIFVLAGIQDGAHLVVGALSPKDTTLSTILRQAIREALVGDPQTTTLGVLNVEHFGKNGHDGMCITTLVKLHIFPGKALPVIRDRRYTWVQVSPKHIDNLRYCLEGHIVKLIDKH